MFQPNNRKTVPSTMQGPPEIPVRKRTRGIVPFVAAMIPNAVVFALTLQFYSVPRGAVIRPMGWAGFCAMAALASLGVIPLSIYYMKKHRCYFWPSLAIVLALLPFPLSNGMLHHAEQVRGFVMAP